MRVDWRALDSQECREQYDVVLTVIANRVEVAVTRVDERLARVELSRFAIIADIVRQRPRSKIDEEAGACVAMPGGDATCLDRDSQDDHVRRVIDLNNMRGAPCDLVSHGQPDVVEERAPGQ